MRRIASHRRACFLPVPQGLSYTLTVTVAP